MNMGTLSGGRPVLVRLSGRGPALGTSSEEYYTMAKTELARFIALAARIDRIANKTAREAIMSWLGSEGKEDDPLWTVGRVRYGLFVADSYVPPNTDYYNIYRHYDHVDNLKSNNNTLEGKVAHDEGVYGILPAPEVITVTGPGTTTTVRVATDLTVPIVAAAGIVGVALIAAFVL